MNDELLPPSKPLLRIEGYEIIREIGRGGQAFVYQAIQATTNRKVAVKVLRRFAEANDEAAARFVREIRLIAQFPHPNIVSVLHSGQLSDGRHFYVMEYVRGVPARQHVLERALPVQDILRLFITICRAVDHLHRHGVVHRDLKPSNLLVDESGEVKVIDFGLAKNVAAPPETMATTTGVVLGSLLYMSPEQARGRTHDLTPRTDVYSLGVLLFELLTGEFPYAVTGQFADVIKRIMDSAPARPSEAWKSAARRRAPAEPPPSEADCPIDATLDAICLRAMEKDAPRRYANAGELAEEIGHYLNGEPTRARPERWHQSIRRRLRHSVRRHRLSFLAACVVAAVALGNYPGIRLVFAWTPLDRWFETTVAATVNPAFAESPFQHTRMVAITEETDIDGIAASEGLQEVSSRERVSLRRLHGRFMRRLADSGCRAVIWDITFPTPTRFDEDFVDGAKALRSVGIDVVVAVRNWWLDASTAPEISAAIAPHVRWGCVAAALSDVNPWGLQLVARRGSADPQLGLALEGLAATLHPLTEFRVDLPYSRLAPNVVELSFWRPDPELMTRRTFLPQVVRMALSSVRPVDSLMNLPPGAFGLQARSQDVVGLLVINMPATEVLERATVDYGAVFAADAETLKSMFSGRAVLVGDVRSASRDLHPHAGGRTIPGVAAHATALEVMLRGLPIELPSWVHCQSVPFLGALMGLAVGVFSASLWKRVATGLGLTILLLAASWVAFRHFQFMVNPFMAILPMLAAFAMATAVERAARVRHA